MASLAILGASMTGQAASLGNASLSGNTISAAIVPDTNELNQTAKVYVAAFYQGAWLIRGAGLNDWQPYTGGTLPIAQQLVLRPQSPVVLSDLSIASKPGLVLYLAYSSLQAGINAPGHLRAVYTVPGGPSLPDTPRPVGLLAPVDNGEGASATFTSAGSIDTGNLFFKPLGNGRACASCHDQGAGWSITPDTLARRFSASNGLDPVFRLNDGANSPNAKVDTQDQRFAAYSMLRSKGLIRVGLGIPAGAEFTLAAVDDPYGYASAKELSLFRRPL
ncbi:hypothetical protein, partial [Chitinimonas sp.]|uniref:hypothetical protein n=1 Tax=Chitinimonas sp. TaxID=1934313 RepID=UPI0035AF4A26